MRRAFQLCTSDAEEFQAKIAPLAGNCHVRPVKGARFAIDVRAARFGALSMFVVKSPSLRVITAPPHAVFGLNLPLGKPFWVTEAGRRQSFNNDIHLLTPERILDVQAESDMRALAVKLDSKRVVDFAFKLSGLRKPMEPAIGNAIPFSFAEYDAILRSIAGVWSELKRKDASAASALALEEHADAVFSYFCLATQREEEKKGGGPGERNISRRVDVAEEYLRASLDKPVSRAELAAAAGVSIRSLSRGFAERRGIGPMGFLRKLRMEATYRELLGAVPGSTSVTAVAYRYGFNHLGKFAVEYKRTFHESPSETLRY